MYEEVLSNNSNVKHLNMNSARLGGREYLIVYYPQNITFNALDAVKAEVEKVFKHSDIDGILFLAESFRVEVVSF